MILDAKTLQSTKDYLNLLESDVTIHFSDDNSQNSETMASFLEEIKNLSNRITIEKTQLSKSPAFSITSPFVQNPEQIIFAGVPLGHEYSSFIMAILQVSGRKPKISEETIEKIKNIKETLNFITYISLSCHNCPEVVQAINIMSALNTNVKHIFVDGAFFQNEVEKQNIMAVPTIYLNNNHFHAGKIDLEEILIKLLPDNNESTTDIMNQYPTWDCLIIGGGPAGTAAAIYSARKGIKTAILSDKFGGQVLDTLSIENFISNQHTEGKILAQQMEEHIKSYNIEQISNQYAQEITKKNDIFNVTLSSGAILKSKTIIISTGAKWRELNIPGEKEFKGKGVAYCAHCDGPLFKNKIVAVIGGGNSGIEAAIDLSSIAKKVYVLEYDKSLRADHILQNKLSQQTNIEIIFNAQTKEILGENKVNGINYIDRIEQKEYHIHLDGVFVQIGLLPNTKWLEGFVDLNKFGEIIIDSHCNTNVQGFFAAGDCTNVPYKQIVISVGEGAKASLSSFDYLIRNS
jgi:NADH-dependent peroxiredoxin subunit F